VGRELGDFKRLSQATAHIDMDSFDLGVGLSDLESIPDEPMALRV
jgi:hypothetical protein